MASSKYKLTYFNAKGLSESIRFIFSYANVKFEDIRITREEWTALKEKSQYGTLPVLEVDGKTLNQSVAICRYLGKRFNLTNSDPFIDALLEALVDNIKDAMIKVMEGLMKKTPESLKQGEEVLQALMKKIEPLANEGYFFGSKATWVDIHFTGIIDSLEDYMPNVLNSFPKLRALCDKIKSNDGIQNYIKNRPPHIHVH